MTLPENFLVSGTPEQLAILLPLLEAQYQFFKNLKTDEGSSNRPPVSPEFIDYLQVTVCWRGSTNTTHKPHVVEKSIRLKDINPKTVNLAYLQQLGRLIFEKFNNLSFKTGHVKVKYCNWKDGFQTWGYFDTKETGYKIIESMGDIAGKSINKKLLKYEYIDDINAFNEIPDKISIANELVRPKPKAPIANMYFYDSKILFPWIGHTEKLCSISGYVLENLDFLEKYKD